MYVCVCVSEGWCPKRLDRCVFPFKDALNTDTFGLQAGPFSTRPLLQQYKQTICLALPCQISESHTQTCIAPKRI